MDLTTMDRQALLDYIETLEKKTASLEEAMEALKEQASLFDFDPDEFKVPDGDLPELKVSEQTADALAEAASIFEDLDTVEVEPAPVENGKVRLGAVREEEDYIPPAASRQKKTVKVKTPVKVKVKKNP